MKLGIREIVLVCVLLAMLGGSYFLIFARANAHRKQLEADIRQKRRLLDNVVQATAGIDDFNRKIADLQKAIIFFESKLPQEKEVDKILKEVSQMAEANRLQVKLVKTLHSKRGSHYSEQPIELKLSGDFNGFYSFLQQLEKLPRITRITKMKLAKINDHDGDATADITLSIFFEPDSAANDTGQVASVR